MTHVTTLALGKLSAPSRAPTDVGRIVCTVSYNMILIELRIPGPLPIVQPDTHGRLAVPQGIRATYLRTVRPVVERFSGRSPQGCG